MSRILVVMVLAAALLVPALPVRATEPLSVGSAVRQALAYAPDLKARQSGERIAGSQIQEARAMKGLNVQVGVMESVTDSPLMAFGSRLDQGRISPADFNPSRLNDPDPRENFRMAGRITLPIHLGGMQKNAVRAAEKDQAAASFATEDMREEIIFKTIEAYLSVIVARESLGVAEKACEASRESVKNAEQAVAALRAVESDLLQARVHHSQNEETLLRSKNQFRLALDSLTSLLGLTEADRFELTMPFLEQVCTLCDEDPDALLARALSQRPDFQRLVLQTEGMKSRAGIFRGMLRPHVSVGGALEHNRQGLGESGKAHHLVFARVDWNLSDGGAARQKAAQAGHQSEQLQHLSAALKDRIHLEIREAITNINNAHERIRVSKEAVAQSRESLRILRNRYQAGLAIMSDLLGMESSLLQHEMNHLKAVYDYSISRARLKWAVGELTLEHCDLLQDS